MDEASAMAGLSGIALISLAHHHTLADQRRSARAIRAIVNPPGWIVRSSARVFARVTDS